MINICEIYTESRPLSQYEDQELIQNLYCEFSNDYVFASLGLGLLLPMFANGDVEASPVQEVALYSKSDKLLLITGALIHYAYLKTLQEDTTDIEPTVISGMAESP